MHNVDYIRNLFAQEDDILKEVLYELKQKDIPPMSIPAEVGHFLYILLKMLSPKNVLELGTLGGYSTIWLARALSRNKDSHLWTVDLSVQRIEMAKKNLKKAGIEGVTYCVGSAEEWLYYFLAQGKKFDFFFIDADKQGCPLYLELAYKLANKGSVIVIDNLLNKAIFKDEDKRPVFAKTLHDFNVKIANDNRFISTILPIGDGLGLFYTL